METLKEAPEYRISAVFKSYYVVWKPQVGCEDKMSSRKFKSYYVVWKRGWKFRCALQMTHCLNRTM